MSILEVCICERGEGMESEVCRLRGFSRMAFMKIIREDFAVVHWLIVQYVVCTVRGITYLQ